MSKRILFLFTVIWCSLSVAGLAQINQNWKWLHPNPQGNRLNYIKAWSPTSWYAVGFAGTFMKTTNGGTSWSVYHNAGRKVGTSEQFTSLYDAHFFNANTGIVVGGNGTISRTTNAGLNWTDVSPLPLTSTVIFYQLYFVNDTKGYACGSSGNFYKTTDAGLTWTQVTTSSTVTLYDVVTPNDTLFVCASTAGNVLRSTDGGTTWASVNTGTTSSLFKVDFVNKNLGFAVGSAGASRITTDGGATWAGTISPSTNALYDIDFRPFGTGFRIYVTGDPFYVYRSSNNGTSWDTLGILGNQPWTSTFYAADLSTTGDSLVAVGAFGLIQGRIGAGAMPFNNVASVSTKYDVAVSSNGQNVIAIGVPSSATVKDQIMRSTDGGTSWTVVPFSTTSTATLWSIDMVTDQIGYISGTNSAVYKTTNGGATWDSVITTTLPAGCTFRKVDFVNATTGWVFASAPNTLTNFIYKTTDGGATWVAQSNGLSAVSNGQMYGAHMISPTYGYAVSYQPIPYKTTDGGTTWVPQSLVDGFGGFLYDIKMIDTAVGYACGSSGRLYKTTNGGALWDTISVPTRTYSFQALEVPRPGVLVLVGGTGVTMLSTNNGSTWTVENTQASSVTINGAAVATGQGGNSYNLFAVGTASSMFKYTNFIVPVELTSFGASVSGGKVTLLWKTATELNNSGFDIERKAENGQWQKIGFVTGAGTTTSGREYAYADANAGTGKFTYRLRQVDFNGAFSFSNEVEVDLSSPFVYGLDQNYPNPFNPATSINYRLAEKTQVTLKIYDMIGNEVKTLVNTVQDAGTYNVKFDASGLASGVYVYKINAGKYTQSLKMMFVK